MPPSLLDLMPVSFGEVRRRVLIAFTAALRRAGELRLVLSMSESNRLKVGGYHNLF